MKIYQIDVFSAVNFKGNPAAVCPLPQWADTHLMQNIAQENNLSETAFFVPQANGDFEIRWFTPAAEVNLCGHATMATAYVLYNELGYKKDVINFSSKSGKLVTRKIGDAIEIDLPKASFEKIPYNKSLEAALGKAYQELYFAGEDYLVIFDDEKDVANLTPDFNLLKEFKVRGVVVSSAGSEFDFVSRAFFPRLDVNEDPVCGSAHTHLTPYWSARLGKNELHAKQISARAGELFCSIKEDRVLISGKCKLYLRGEIFL